MRTNQIKLFEADDAAWLEHKVNRWLLNEGEAIEVLDMQLTMAEVSRLAWSAPARAVVMMVSYIRHD